MPHLGLEQKPREVAYRRWMRLARVALYAPVPIMVGILTAVYVGWLPNGIENDHLWLLMLGALAITAFASWMAGRRYTAMTKEWGHRKAVRWGVVPNDLPTQDDR